MRGLFNLSVIYISTFALIFGQTLPAYAGFIGTEQLIAQQLADQDREALQNAVDRDEARSILIKYGVSAEHVQGRIDSMTDEEVRALAQNLEKLPAAGGVGVIAAVLIIVLLLIALDLSGKTDIFKGI